MADVGRARSDRTPRDGWRAGERAVLRENNFGISPARVVAPVWGSPLVRRWPTPPLEATRDRLTTWKHAPWITRVTSPVPQLRRHDLGPGEAVSDAELRRRWRRFYLDVLIHSPHRIERVVSPFLGNNTRRHRAFTAMKGVGIFRRRTAPSPEPSLKNYAPRHLTSGAHGGAVRDVTVLEVDGLATASTLEVIARRARDATTPWLFVTDVSVSDADRRVAINSLLHEARSGEVIFADERRPGEALPIFKSSVVGAHSLLSYNQVGRPTLIPTEELRRVGGIRCETGPAFEHDVYLRLREARVRFTHHDDVLPAGRPASYFVDPAITDATSRVCADALSRRGLTGRVRATARPSVVSWHVRPDHWPAVDIVIPTRDRLDLLTRCLDSLEALTRYPAYHLTILDNDSVEAATLEFLAASNYDVVRCPGPFNYAAIVNRGVAHTTAPLIVTMNNDIVVEAQNWLEEMVGAALSGDVGIVGATQVDRGGEHDHDGIIIAPYPQHLRSGVNYKLRDESLFARRDVSAVTGAVQLIRRDVWTRLGGMDEELAVVLNDVDLCLRAQVAGYHVVMIPDVRFTHDAGSTRGRLEPVADRNRFVRRWDIFGTFRDPYFPSSLHLVGSDIVYRPTIGR